MEGVAMPAMPLFISVSEAASLPNRCFIDVRSRVVHGWDALGAYSKGHIAGAQFLAFDRVFARDPVFGLGRHPWSDRRTVAAHLLGVLGPAGNAHHRVIFYDDGGMNFAARAALCARWAGFMNAQILDGGLSAWARCGLPLNDGAPAAADHPAAERVNDFLRQTIAGAVPQILGKAAFFNAVKQGDRLVIDADRGSALRGERKIWMLGLDMCRVRSIVRPQRISMLTALSSPEKRFVVNGAL